MFDKGTCRWLITTSRIKDICDSLASINVTVEEDEMVQICLGGLAYKFGPF